MRIDKAHKTRQTAQHSRRLSCLSGCCRRLELLVPLCLQAGIANVNVKRTRVCRRCAANQKREADGRFQRHPSCHGTPGRAWGGGSRT